MPTVKFKAIESFSSEDPNYPAANLLRPDNRKWKCRQPGEQTAFVVIRLEEPVQISGIDIGNEHSAFIEVLVARSGPVNPTFSEMLLATKFMSMVESRNSTSTNRLQCFSGSSLLPTVAQEKWDLVKVICTQDFNTRVKFGLTFITLHTTSGKKGERSLVPEKFQQMIKAEASKKQPESGTAGGIALAAFGRFKLREESPDSDEEGTKVFARWKQKTEIATAPQRPASSGTTSTLLRDIKPSDALLKKKESSLPSIHPGMATTRPKPQKYESSDEDEKLAGLATGRPNRNDESLLYDPEDCKPSEKKLAIKPTTVPERPHRPKENARSADKTDKNASKLSSSKFSEFLQFTGQTVDGPGASRAQVSKEGKPPSTQDKERQDSSKHVLSRSESAAKRMSSLPIDKESVAVKKRPPSPTADNAGPSSSSQATKKIKPETSEPVSRQEDEPKRLRYKPFGKLFENVVLAISGIQHPERGNIRGKALAMGAKYRPDWDSSCTHLICAYKNTPKYNQVKGKGKIVEKDWIEKCYSLRRKLSWRKFALDTEECQVTDSEDEIVDIAQRPVEDEPVALSEDDETTSEQVGSRVEASDSEVQPDERGRMPYDISTDDEAGCNDDQSNGGLDFFKDYTFYIDRDVGAVDTMKLERFIKTYRGTMTKAINDADFIVTRSKRLVESSCKARLVKPLWIFECNEMECFIPLDRYLL
ncbi:DNA repair protein XRCC1-like [Anopheles albimanus]|uniref:BRCT domain-containing protein n=1 Tax=Anopheles albimanus TaxID=7167 RepID=A0A8W7K9E5_ANOAL|nr:DNA repair protein XRCC1-like [Anopheles albimanus]